MLGEKIGEEHGKVTGRRILPGDDYRYVKMEISFEAQGSGLGQTGMNMGTYTVFERIPGQLYGEGRGIFMTQDGQGVIWSGFGIGRITAGGDMTFAVSLSYQTNSDQLARLNGVIGVAESTTDAAGNMHTVTYEWKA